MESPSPSPSPTPPHTLTLSHSGSLRQRRSSSDSNSPEFEFWRLGGNPLSFPQPALHSADELFSDGFLLPLHLLHHHHPQQPPSDLDPDPDPKPDPEPETEAQLEPGPGPVLEESELSMSASITFSVGNPILTASKRWKEIFKRGDKKAAAGISDEAIKTKSEKSGKKREKKIAGNNGTNNNDNNNGGNSNSNPAELNINIWPFSRSRSAGNNAGRSRPAVASANRKVSSAPCSRSNSSGDSKSRRAWPNSPGRTGVHLGRTSPVWQVRRSKAVSDEGRRGKPANSAGKGRVLNLNVPMCMGYRQQLSCRSDDHDGSYDGGGDGGAARSGAGAGGNSGSLLGLRGLFSKKSVLTV